jgi:soluble lytic murein transglycosylase-like protein
MNKKSIALNPPGQAFPVALSLLLLLGSLCFPSLPLAESKARRLHEISRIFSMLQSSNMGLSYPSTRALAETVWQESKKYSLDPMLVLAVIKVESEFQSGAVSVYGARGLMQLLPNVAYSLAENTDLDGWEGEKSLHDPITNIKLGAYYLGQLKERFGDLKIALTAYNRGPTWVQKRIEDRTSLPFGYAIKVLSMFRDYRQQSRQPYSSTQARDNTPT